MKQKVATDVWMFLKDCHKHPEISFLDRVKEDKRDSYGFYGLKMDFQLKKKNKFKFAVCDYMFPLFCEHRYDGEWELHLY